MSDIKIVSKDEFQQVNNSHVPYGTILDDDAEHASEAQSMEGLFAGAVPAVDWRGVDAPRKPGRPKGSKNKVK